MQMLSRLPDRKKAIIILSDGVDNSSSKSLARVMRLAAEREVTVKLRNKPGEVFVRLGYFQEQ